MAHLEVRRKPSRPWWLWALIIILAIALGATVFHQSKQNPELHPSAIAATDNTETKNKAVAATTPDWEHIDFNSVRATDPDIKATDIYTQTDGNYTIYGLGENVLFAPKSSELSKSGTDKLQEIAQLLNKKFPSATIGIFGNTDANETADDLKVGMLRAEAVKNWLANEGKIPATQLSVRSLGDSQPVASNQTAEGRKQNRNVAIVAFPKKN